MDFIRDESGQGLVEYALIIALVVVVAIVAIRLLGTKVTATLQDAADALPDAGS